jgi:arylformamidase
MLYDISPLLSRRLAVWPGDAPLSREILTDLEAGAASTVSALRATVHLGAHADAPSHYGLGAPTIDERDPGIYLGPCRVIRVAVAPRGVILKEMIRNARLAPRVLFATGTFPDPEVFREDFAALSPEAIRFLADGGVRLVGIDTPSVDTFASEDLAVHRACLELDVAILEGLVLDGVPEGIYELIALPLRLAGFDGSPVRAVLRAPGVP